MSISPRKAAFSVRITTLVILAVFRALSVAEAQTTDLEAAVNQSAVDKIIRSIDFPYTAFDDDVGKNSTAISERGNARDLSTTEMAEMIHRVRAKRGTLSDSETAFKQLLETARESTLETLRHVQKGDVEGAPPEADLSELVEFFDGKRSTLTNKGFLCFKGDAEVTHARVEVLEPPIVRLGGGRIDFRSMHVQAKAWIRITIGYPGICCKCWLVCCPWFCCKTTSIEVRPSAGLTTSAYAWPQEISESTGKSVAFFAYIRSLHLSDGLLGLIPLEGFVNPKLKDKPLVKIPLDDFAVAISPLRREMRVSSVRFRDAPDTLAAQLTIEVRKTGRRSAR